MLWFSPEGGANTSFLYRLWATSFLYRKGSVAGGLITRGCDQLAQRGAAAAKPVDPAGSDGLLTVAKGGHAALCFGEARGEKPERADVAGVGLGLRFCAARAPHGKGAYAGTELLVREHGAPARRRSVVRLAGVARARGHSPVAELDANAMFAVTPGESIGKISRDESPDYTQHIDQECFVVGVVEKARLARGADGRRGGLACGRLVCLCRR